MVAVLLVVLVGAGCSSGSKSSSEDAGSSSICPQTEFDATNAPGGLYGSPELATWAVSGPAYLEKSDAGTYFMKIGWQRGSVGWVDISATQLDGTGTAVSHVDRSGPTSGGMPSGVDFSNPGCWQVVGRLNGAEVTFVTEVKDSADGTGVTGS